MTLSYFFEKACKILTRASVDRKSETRNIIVSNLDGEYPDSRIMVLREVDIERKSFTFFSDKNSKKIKILSSNPLGCILAWDRKNQIQIRAKGNFVISPHIEEYWSRLSVKGKASYGNYPVPSTPISSPEKFAARQTKASFSVLKFFAEEFDVLWLRREKHVRATYDSSDSWKGSWIVP